MKAPFVARAHHDEVVALYERTNAQLRADVVALRAQLSAALMPHAVITTTSSTAAPAQRVAFARTRDRDIVVEKIREESGGDARLAAHYTKLAAQLRREGKSPEDIAQEIGWTTDSPLGAD